MGHLLDDVSLCWSCQVHGANKERQLVYDYIYNSDDDSSLDISRYSYPPRS